MTTFISMLRGINVAGKTIRMAELKSAYEELNFTGVKTYLQSGNVIFASPEADEEKLAAAIEKKIEQVFKLTVKVFVRDPHYFRQLIADNPFLKGGHADLEKLHVTFLDHSPSKTALSGLASPNQDGDEFFLGSRELYLYCPNGYGRTRLSNTFFEKKLKMPATTRNWKSVNALSELAHEE